MQFSSPLRYSKQRQDQYHQRVSKKISRIQIPIESPHHNTISRALAYTIQTLIPQFRPPPKYLIAGTLIIPITIPFHPTARNNSGSGKQENVICSGYPSSRITIAGAILENGLAVLEVALDVNGWLLFLVIKDALTSVQEAVTSFVRERSRIVKKWKRIFVLFCYRSFFGMQGILRFRAR